MGRITISQSASTGQEDWFVFGFHIGLGFILGSEILLKRMSAPVNFFDPRTERTPNSFAASTDANGKFAH